MDATTTVMRFDDDRPTTEITADDIEVKDDIQFAKHVGGQVLNIVEVPNRGLLRITFFDIVTKRELTLQKRPRTKVTRYQSA